ncbi:MAG: hypothetical protein ACOYJH_02980 [Anaerovoracaceae bacterium]|jgi:hypothetical protein
MIEETIIAYLNKALDVPAYLERPESPGSSYVLVEKTGSGVSDHISSGTFTLQSYAGSLYAAASLNDKVKKAMFSAVSEPEIASVSLNSDYNFTDPSTEEYRYQAVFDIVHYDC